MIKNNIGELIGNTPLVRLNKLVNKNDAEVIAKLEYYNPASSIKDRIAWAMIEDAEKKGIINKDTTIIEPSSGNTGVALALVCAVKGYRLTVVMPESMSIERRKLMAGMGAEIVLTEASLGMTGAINKSQALLNEIQNSHMLMQFDNKANPEIHRKTTAEEIWRDTEGKIDIVVAGVGTGGTISGVGEVLKKYNPAVKIIAVEPEKSPVISGGTASPHKIQGLGAGIIPSNFNREIVDEVMLVSNEDAINTAQDLMKYEGILAGISSGANAWAAIELAKRYENKGKMILFFACDTSERYLSTDLYEL
ncbi:MAG: cysteine synthase A [Bacteroidota bacterium]